MKPPRRARARPRRAAGDPPAEPSRAVGPAGRRRGRVGRRPALGSLSARTDYTASVAELSERAVSERVPSLARETLRVVNRRDPLTVPEGTSLGQCLRLVEGCRAPAIWSSWPTPTGRLRGVLTERDIFGVMVGGQVDLTAPVETLMNRSRERSASSRPSTTRSPCSPTGATATSRSSTMPAAWSAWSASRTSSSTSPRRSRRSC